MFGALVALVVSSPAKFLYDERYFADNFPLLRELGPGAEFVRSLKFQSPGPLYQYLHAVLEPVTGLAPVPMRVANLCLFVIVALILHRFGATATPANGRSILPMLLRAPTTWVTAGLALTEMPAILFLTASLFVLRSIVQSSRHTFREHCAAVLAGVLLGISVTGRTQFVVVIAAALVLAVERRMRGIVLLFCVSAAILPAWLFWTWGGLVPPDVQAIQSGLNPYFGLLAMGYLSFITFFMCPGWFVLRDADYWGGAVVALTFMVVNYWLEIGIHLPLQSFMEERLPEALIRLISHATPALLAGVTFLYCVSLAKHVWANRQDLWFVFLTVALLLVVGTCVKSSAQFSSRYVAQAIPFIVLLCTAIPVRRRLETACGLAGGMLGLLSLSSYYAR
jgi:hypothetical protein